MRILSQKNKQKIKQKQTKKTQLYYYNVKIHPLPFKSLIVFEMLV